MIFNKLINMQSYFSCFSSYLSKNLCYYKSDQRNLNPLIFDVWFNQTLLEIQRQIQVYLVFCSNLKTYSFLFFNSNCQCSYQSRAPSWLEQFTIFYLLIDCRVSFKQLLLCIPFNLSFHQYYPTYKLDCYFHLVFFQELSISYLIT